MEIATDAAQEMPNEILPMQRPPKNRRSSSNRCLQLNPMLRRTAEPSVPPEPIAEATDVPDIHEVPTEVLSADMPSPDMAATPEFTAESVSKNEMTDEIELLRNPHE